MRSVGRHGMRGKRRCWLNRLETRPRRRYVVGMVGMLLQDLFRADREGMLRSGTNSRITPTVSMQTLPFDKVPMTTIGDDVVTTKSF